RLNRAIVLKEILLELLDGLRPHDGAGRVTSDAWRFYNCLYYPYVRGISRRRAPTVLRQLVERRKREGGARSDLEQVVDWLVQANEDTFYKWQRRGSDTIAAALRERETAAGGVMPMAGDVPAPELARAGGPAHVRGSGAPARCGGRMHRRWRAVDRNGAKPESSSRNGGATRRRAPRA